MNVVRSDNEAVTFRLDDQEQIMLADVLSHYPVMPSAHYAVSNGIEDCTEAQHLLDEALAVQRAANKNRLDAWLRTDGRFMAVANGCELIVAWADREWLLQTLNDIRVGSWVLLGSPDDAMAKPRTRDRKKLRQWAVMQISGYFQSMLLDTLPTDSKDSGGHGPPLHT